MTSDSTSSTIAIVNPMANSGRAGDVWPQAETQLRAIFPNLQSQLTRSQGHATELCRQALESGAQTIISVGGDGTTSEVLAGFVDEQGHNRFPDAVLCPLAAGTGGDFQRIFGKRKLAAQIRQLAQAQVQSIDYGVAEFTDHAGERQIKPFLNVASVGVSGEVVRHVNKSNNNLGPTATYLLGSLKGILGHKNQQVFLQSNDGEKSRVDLTLCCIANGQYFGSGMWVSPHSQLDSGHFETVLASGLSRTQLLTTLAKVFKGKHLKSHGVKSASATQIELAPVWEQSQVLIELDGEQPGKLPARFEIVPKGIKIRIGGRPS